MYINLLDESQTLGGRISSDPSRRRYAFTLGIYKRNDVERSDAKLHVLFIFAGLVFEKPHF